MKNYLFRIVRADDTDYTAAVEFALPAYESRTLQRIRQAFPAYVGMFRFERLHAVCGFRSAAGGLFLEQFMSDSADRYVTGCENAPVTRSAIVELGAFRVRAPALTPLFAAQIERLLAAEGFSHALALSASGARTVTDWAKERTSMASGSPVDRATTQAPVALEVSVIRLRGSG